ncbi:MAG: hypothetical protein CR986_05720 [Ignavibacteriae bacterium]|nr:MAG: hypothetical protein CR986_05720 [Ignavibacteriota bacterium]
MLKKSVKLTFIFIFLQLTTFAQVGYVEVEDDIYEFLERMSRLHIIKNYDAFQIPKTRKEIAKYLKKILNNKDKLHQTDINKLTDYFMDFELELTSEMHNDYKLLPDFNLSYILTDKNKFLYQIYDSSGSSIFINFVGELKNINLSKNNKNKNSLIYKFGGKVRASLYNNFGFYINSTNGSFFGNKELAQNYSSLRYNYKFHQTSSSNLGNDFFDETSSYLVFENNFMNLKIGNDRNLIGYGKEKFLLSNNAPRMDYLNFNVKYKTLNFTFYHGKLLGSESFSFDSLQGNVNKVVDKYWVYHRFGLNFSRHFKFGIGEIIIYGNRNIDFSYLNPINFYKSAEHANRDRDNSMLFIDVENNSIYRTRIYSTLLIDDIDFGKLGTGWYGNQILFTLGANSSIFYNFFPLDLELQYTRIDPYVFTHRISDNNYTNLNYSLGTTLQPNTSSINLGFNYYPHYRFSIKGNFKYSVHGNNLYDNQNKLIKNLGGNILNGHRIGDAEKVFFLKGDKEYFREYRLTLNYEPIKNWHFVLNLNYFYNLLSNSQHQKEFFTSFSILTKI